MLGDLPGRSSMQGRVRWQESRHLTEPALSWRRKRSDPLAEAPRRASKGWCVRGMGLVCMAFMLTTLRTQHWRPIYERPIRPP